MKRKQDLFDLVQSLSKSEKRFFKVFSSRHVLGEQNNYVALFDAIETQTTYNEEAILKQFEGEKMINRFSVAKAYLYDLILKAMGVYHTQNTVDNQLNEWLKQVSFLHEKCLFNQALVLLKKAKKLAELNEKLSILPEILRWEKKLMEAHFYSKTSEGEIAQIHKEQKDIQDKIENLNEYWLLDAKLYHHHNTKGMARSKDDLKSIEYVFNSSLMQSEERALSFDAKVLFQRVYATYFFILRDFESCYIRIKKMVDLMEANTEKKQSRPFTYVSSINNLLNITQVLNKKQETEHYLSLLKGLVNDYQNHKSSRLQLKVFEAYYHHQLSFYLEQERTPEAMPIIPEIENGLVKFERMQSPMGQLMMCYNVFLVCFWAGQYEVAAKWIEKVLQSPNSGLRKDIYYFANLLSLINAHELGKDLRPEYERVLDFMTAKKNNNNFEKQALDFVLKIPELTNVNAQIDFFKELKAALDIILLDPFEKKALAYFDFRKWVQNKIAVLS